FAREEATKSTNVLSGGEAARLLFSKLMLQKPNVLVLDEPTNHLDLEAINALNFSRGVRGGSVFWEPTQDICTRGGAPPLRPLGPNKKTPRLKGPEGETP